LSNNDKKYTYIIDDGFGMNREKLESMWDMYRENHINDESGGVSGVGAKPSTLIISNDTTVKIYTKSLGNEYYTAIIPWGDIVKNLRYEGEIKIRIMNSEEQEKYNEYLHTTGTIIEVEKNIELTKYLYKQFIDPKSIDDITQRIDWVFSKFQVEISFKNQDMSESSILNKYNYFGAEDELYYFKDRYEIKVYKMNYGYEYALLDIEKDNLKYYSKKSGGWYLDIFNKFREGKKIGDFDLEVCLRKDDDYFKFSKPIELPGASRVLLNYEKQYISNGVKGEMSGEEIKKNLWYPDICRNSQNIGLIKSLPTLNPASGRSNGEACLLRHHIRTCLSYYVNSTQDNKLDELMGIQENKNQFNSHAIDEKLLRVMEFCMKNSSDKLWKTFEKRRSEYRIQLEEKKKLENIEKENQGKYIKDKTKSESQELYKLTDYEIENKLKCIENQLPKDLQLDKSQIDLLKGNIKKEIESIRKSEQLKEIKTKTEQAKKQSLKLFNIKDESEREKELAKIRKKEPKEFFEKVLEYLTQKVDQALIAEEEKLKLEEIKLQEEINELYKISVDDRKEKLDSLGYTLSHIKKIEKGIQLKETEELNKIKNQIQITDIKKWISQANRTELEDIMQCIKARGHVIGVFCSGGVLSY